ncbi:MAG: ankyrin repeat domain-containing protein, partial [Proteobacteria bacterium]|nr:ankyrin repeat domain-containing protein [Pseudomonadota bacterium]
DGTGVLSYAAAWGNKDVVRYLLDSGLSADINKPNKSGLTPIFFAAYSGNLEVVKMLVEAGANVQIKTNYNENLLMAAVRGRDNDVVYSSPKTNAYQHYASRMLYEQAPDPAMIKYLIDLKVPAYDSDDSGISALHLAARNPLTQPEVIGMLIKAGGDVNGETKKKKYTPLMYAKNTEVAAMLIKKGADIHAVNVDGWTPLHHAIDNNRTEIAELLIKKGADIHAKTNSGKEVADLADSADSIELMRAKGIDFTDALYSELRQSRPAFHPKTILALLKSSRVDDLSEWTENILSGINEISRDYLKADEVTQLIRYLKDHGIDLNQTDAKGRSLLMQACHYKPVIFSALIEQGADIEKKTAMSTPLAYCASVGYDNDKAPKNTALLIEKGANVNVSDSDGVPVIVNLTHKMHALVPLALKAGANPNAADSKGNTPLMVAKSYYVAKALIDAGADVNAKNRGGISVLAIHSGAMANAERDDGWMSEAIDKDYWDKGNYNIVKLLIDSGAKPDAKTIQYTKDARIAKAITGADSAGTSADSAVLLTDKQLKTATYLTPEMVKRYLRTGGKQKVVDDALLEACFWGQGTKIIALAKGGANPNTRHHYKNNTPLIMAVHESEHNSAVTVEAVQALLDAGANINDKNEYGWTALTAACFNDHPNPEKDKFISLLIKSGADVKDALYYISFDHVTPENIQEMIRFGAKVNGKDKEGDTPLHTCWNPRSCKVLLDAGADINAKNKKGETPLISALNETWYGSVKEQKLPELCNLYIQNGADLKIVDKDGKSAMYYAVKGHIRGCVEAFLQAGVDINAKDKKGKTVIEYFEETHPMVKFLKSHGATGKPIAVDEETKRKWEEKNKRNKDKKNKLILWDP